LLARAAGPPPRGPEEAVTPLLTVVDAAAGLPGSAGAGDQCNYKTGKKLKLKTHADVVHSRIRLLCDLCDYNALLRVDLKKHVIAKH